MMAPRGSLTDPLMLPAAGRPAELAETHTDAARQPVKMMLRRRVAIRPSTKAKDLARDWNAGTRVNFSKKTNIFEAAAADSAR